MLGWIIILGGALLMMGQHSRSEALFYYFRLEDQVPENHLLRLIGKAHQLCLRTGKAKRELQRYGSTVSSRAPIATFGK
jgi:hypothetical protein